MTHPHQLPTEDAAASHGNQSKEIEKVLVWASQLSAEERGWVDQAYQPPQEVTQLVKQLQDTDRSLFFLTGFWGVGKSSALQYINDRLCDSRRSVYYLRARPDIAIFDQIVADDVADYRKEVLAAVENQVKAEHRLGRIGDGRMMDVQDSIRRVRAGELALAEFLNEHALAKSTMTRIRSETTIDSLDGMSGVLIDLPDFSRTDRRPLIRALDQVQDLWLRVMKSGVQFMDEVLGALGPNFVITIQRELLDLAPSYFLGKANTIEIKPLSPSELITAYEAKFPTLEPFENATPLDYLAHISRGVFRRFLKFISIVLRDALKRNIERVTLRDAMAAVDTETVAGEMQAELAWLFPKAEPREKATRIIVTLLKNKYEPSLLEKAFDPSLKDRPLSQKRVAEILCLTESDISRLLDRLQTNGLITRERTNQGNILRLNL
jgi:hypothetical protein